MLVLSRSDRQKIIFPTLGISIKVLKISRSKVQIGIEAPMSVPVHRNEVADRIDREDSVDAKPTTRAI